MLGANTINLDEISRLLVDNDVGLFDKNGFLIHNNTPAPQVDFEIRHTREHLEKLKFNWLELHTKRSFLIKLSDTEEWKACQTTKWTPGELKRLERMVEPSKSQLKSIKGETVDLQERLQQACESICHGQGTIQAKHRHADELVKEYQTEQAILAELQQKLPSNNMRSIDELQTILDEQSISLEKKVGALERQKNAVTDLERLLAVHEAENSKLAAALSELEEKKRIVLSKKSGAEEMTLSRLCQWYSGLNETFGKMIGCQVEMIQPNYLLAHLSHGTHVVPVHIYVDPATGRLRSAKMGATSNTPKKQWRETIETAVEYNDIPFLLRTILVTIKGKH